LDQRESPNFYRFPLKEERGAYLVLTTKYSAGYPATRKEHLQEEESARTKKRGKATEVV